MPDIDFELPDGVTLNSAEKKEARSEEGAIIRKITCPNCEYNVKAVIYENYGRFSGKLFVGNNNEIWTGKLASDSSKSKSQILETFNKKVKTHIEKCNKKV